MSDELLFKSATELNSLLTDKKISANELISSFIKKIDKENEELNAFLLVNKEEALKQAEELDEKIQNGHKPGPLEGIPLAVKTNINTIGLETNCASKILEGFVPPFDATAIKRLKDAGVIIIGKTNMDEFAMGSSNEHSAFGPVKNPWDKSRTPGGSSGGSLAAVAAGMSPVSLGSDTAGSVRQPAAFCGVTGLKPTYGRISRYGLIAFASSLDQIGPAARSAEDVAHLLKIMAGNDKYDSTSSAEKVSDYPAMLNESIKGKKIGIPGECFSEGLDDEIKKAVEKVIEFYKDSGCEITEVSLPHMEYAIACYYILAPAEASSNLARYDGIRYGFRVNEALPMRELYSVTRGQGFGEEVKRRIMLGTYVLSAGYYDAYYKKAQKVRTLIQKDFEKVFSDVDFLVTPTTPSTAFKIGEKMDDPLDMYLSDIYTATANLSGIPAISVPCGFDSKGLPIGFQLLGRWFEEGNLLNMAHTYQKATDHHKKYPN